MQHRAGQIAVGTHPQADIRRRHTWVDFDNKVFGTIVRVAQDKINANVANCGRENVSNLPANCGRPLCQRTCLTRLDARF